MDLKEYRTIATSNSASYIEKKSEFIAQLMPVQTNDEAMAFIEEVRRQNRKARHHVYATVCEKITSRAILMMANRRVQPGCRFLRYYKKMY